MVNRLWPLKWVGFSNDPEYKAVRNAAALYAKALNTPNTNTTAKAQKNAAAKENLNIAVKAYFNKNKVRFGSAPAPVRFGNPFRRAPAPAPAPGPAPAPPAGGPVRNSRAPNTGIWPNGTYKPGNVDGKRTSVYKMGTDYYYLFSTNNGRETWVKVKRDGNSNKYSLNRTNGKYYVKTRNANGRAVFTPMSNADAKYAKFKKFYANTFNPTNPQAVLNAMLKNPNANIRNFSANNNVNKNANGRVNFWKEVTSRRAAAMPKKGELQKFKNWYATLPLVMSNQGRAKEFVNVNLNNRRRNATFGGVIGRTNNAANNTPTSRGPFWDAVVAEMQVRRAATA
jgi:hypothetical protein